MKKTALIATVLFAASPLVSTTLGQSLRRDASSGQDRSPAAVNQMSDQTSPLEQRREWLRSRMLAEFSDVDRQAEINAKVDQMSADRIDALVKIYQKREEVPDQDAQRQQAISEAQRQLMIQQYRNRLAAARAGGRAVGYAPVITWLPEGASLGASAIVSPDRRYVRMSLSPFFSRVDGVDTFNFYTGQSGTSYPSYGYPSSSYPSFDRDPTYYNGSRLYPRRPPQPQPQTYYDGLRTRTVYPRR